MDIREFAKRRVKLDNILSIFINIFDYFIIHIYIIIIISSFVFLYYCPYCCNIYLLASKYLRSVL